MHVSGFMIEKDDVATASPTETLQAAGAKMLEKNIGCLVVLEESKDNDIDHIPVGILTKTDFLKAYVSELPLTTTQVRDIMIPKVITVRETLARDQAARSFARNKNHHAVVVDAAGHFLGVISALDIVREAVRDDQAFPWIRSDDGKFHHPTKEPQSPRSAADEDEGVGDHRSSFLAMVDSIREMPFMDD